MTNLSRRRQGGAPTRLGAMLLGVLAAGCTGYESEASAPGYAIEVVADGITRVDGLAWHPSGAVLASEEYRGGGVARIDPESGAFTYLIRNLAAPDNVLVVEGSLYITEEFASGRIIEVDHLGQITVFANDLKYPEGLDIGPDRHLYVAEHTPSGHVYRYSLSGTRELVGAVSDGEGLRVLPDGSVVVAETSHNRIARLSLDGDRELLAEGRIEAPDGLLYDAAQDRLLVTEDATPGRLLALDLDSEELDVVATGLNAPQTMLWGEDGSILLAEQGEKRILRLRPLDVADAGSP